MATAPVVAPAYALDNEDWALRCQNKSERDELLDYAESRGIPTWRPKATMYEPLLIGWYKDLMVYAGEDDGPMITPADFRAMCDAYAARHA